MAFDFPRHPPRRTDMSGTYRVSTRMPEVMLGFAVEVDQLTVAAGPTGVIGECGRSSQRRRLPGPAFG